MAKGGGGKLSGKAGTIVTMALLTVLGAAAGGLVGKLVVGQMRASSEKTAAAPEPEKAKPYTDGAIIKELPAILTNLAQPHTAVARLQVAIVYSKKPEEDQNLLNARIGDDFMAYLKTVSLTQIQGASGLQSLREDLSERAAIRSHGNVREVIIEALVTQ